MKIFQSSSHLGRVKPCAILWQALAGSSLKCAKEFAAHTVFHTEVEVFVGLEGVVEGDNERMVGGGQNLLLGQSTLDLLPCNHLFLREYWKEKEGQCRLRQSDSRHTLHGKEFAGLLFSNQVDFADITSSEHLDLLETAWSDLDLYKRYI
jgi:hypothetical protein